MERFEKAMMLMDDARAKVNEKISRYEKKVEQVESEGNVVVGRKQIYLYGHGKTENRKERIAKIRKQLGDI